jgi:hypothetical protein
LRIFELRIGDVLDLDFSRPSVDDATIAGHVSLSLMDRTATNFQQGRA